MDDCIIKSCGIDYVTLTSVGEGTKRRMVEYFNGIVEEDQRLGYKPRRGGAHGFLGEATRHALLADREERRMLRVSGQAAQRAFKLMRAGDNCTRLDIQITAFVGEGKVPETMNAIESQARSAPAIRGKKPKVKATRGDQGVETIYIGKRQSEVFIRIYDKYEESGEEEYKGCIRFEVELKGDTSKELWNYCAQHGEGTGYLLNVLCEYLLRRGVAIPRESIPTKEIRLFTREKTKDERTIGWWITQVAPTVRRLTGWYGWQFCFHRLFEGSCTEFDKSAILNAMSISYGD